uniref:Tetratricopeptide SHNi-TPR domain-containing protein n=1 Tax=Peronospora matthiolae TaxID=2874970 RepID=A0AAV1U5C5_9STRA
MAATTTTTCSSGSSLTAQALEKTLQDPRYVRGVTLLQQKRLDEALVVLEDLLRTMCDVEKKSDSLEVAPVCYEYGHALLSLHETTAGVFQCATSAAAGRSRSEEDEASGEAEEGGAPNALDEDLEAAWDVMELARVIYSRYPGDEAVEKQLVRVYTRLGDLGLESDQFEQAKVDFEKALELRKKLLKSSQAEDTTQLADLYCQLAITCIYRDAKPDNKETTETGSKAELGYYVMAGRIMAENIHRVAKKCDEKLQLFVDARVPTYCNENDESVDVEGSGKRKASSSAEASKLSLKFHGDRPDAVGDAFLACVGVKKEEKGTLRDDEKTLLEYLEIYVEIKEKVDSIKESMTEAGDEEAKEDSIPVTTVGFEASDAVASVVNVMSVKKRKTAAPAAMPNGATENPAATSDKPTVNPTLADSS